MKVFKCEECVLPCYVSGVESMEKCLKHAATANWVEEDKCEFREKTFGKHYKHAHTGKEIQIYKVEDGNAKWVYSVPHLPCIGIADNDIKESDPVSVSINVESAEETHQKFELELIKAKIRRIDAETAKIDAQTALL